jgi:prepilin-type N-terminal cleavage/methylation domain-containing protein
MRNKMREVRHKNGFSLVEVLFAVLLVGLAIVALVTASGSFTIANGAGADLSTAEFLIEQIRELTTLLPVVDPESATATFGPEEADLAGYDDLDDFSGVSLSPPISANRQVLTDFAAFTQQITVENVSATDFEQVVSNHASPFVRLTVRVALNSKEISSASWIRARY